MGRMSPKYSTEQKQALHDLVLEQGQSSADACRVLAQGYQDLPAVEMPEASARAMVSRERARRANIEIRKRLADAHEVNLDNVQARLARVIEIEIERAEDRLARRDGKGTPAKELRELAGALKTLRSIKPVTNGNAQAEQESTMSREAEAMMGE